MARILFIDDDPAGRQLSLYNLRHSGHEVDEAEDGKRGLEMLDPVGHDLVITDLRMPGMSGLEVLREVKRRAPAIPVLVITAFGSIERAVEAMRAGASDFVLKPFNREQLLLSVSRALEHRRLRDENRRLKAQIEDKERPIIGRSAAMQKALEVADRVAATDASVMITGESGTGKELFARRIHARSARGSGNFVPVNCAAIPAPLIEAELFGHERGAFTGADRARLGRFRQAEGGTLFLDEVVELPEPQQAKLLRALQERQIDVVGRDQPVPVDVRIVAASNRDLEPLIQQGRFREDLYYRLNVVGLRVPPLRERVEDIEPLARHFVASLSTSSDIELPDEVIAALQSRTWPGNVRELQNACERIVILAGGGPLRVEDLPPAAESHAAPTGEWPDLPPEGLSLLDLEKRVIERVLALKSGNVSQAARYLAIPRHVLAYRMEKYGINKDGS